MSLFHLWVTFQVEILSYCTLAETFANGFQNKFYLENVNFGGFGKNLSRFVSIMSERVTPASQGLHFAGCEWSWKQSPNRHHVSGDNHCGWLRTLRNIDWQALALQCNYTFYLFASSSQALPKIVKKYFVDYFWKPISPFSKFCAKSLLRFYFVYCSNCVLNDVNGTC